MVEYNAAVAVAAVAQGMNIARIRHAGGGGLLQKTPVTLEIGF